MPPKRRMEKAVSKPLGLPTIRLYFLRERFWFYLRKYNHFQREPVLFWLWMIQMVCYPFRQPFNPLASRSEPPRAPAHVTQAPTPVAPEPWVMLHRNKTSPHGLGPDQRQQCPFKSTLPRLLSLSFSLGMRQGQWLDVTEPTLVTSEVSSSRWFCGCLLGLFSHIWGDRLWYPTLWGFVLIACSHRASAKEKTSFTWWVFFCFKTVSAWPKSFHLSLNSGGLRVGDSERRGHCPPHAWTQGQDSRSTSWRSTKGG